MTDSICVRYFKALIMIIFVMPFFPSSLNAQPLKIKVLTEEQNPELTRCGIEYETLKYNIESAIRYNNQRVDKSDDADLIAYLNVNSLPIERSSSGFTGFCAVSYSVQFYKYAFDTQLPDFKERMTTNEFCQRGGLMLNDQNEAQADLSSTIRNYVEVCLGKIINAEPDH